MPTLKHWAADHRKALKWIVIGGLALKLVGTSVVVKTCQTFHRMQPLIEDVRK